MILAKTQNALLESALRYAAMGYPVFPLVPGEKRPATANGLKDATADPSIIRQWWAENPRYNIGLRCDGLLVLDLDGPENQFLRDKPSVDFEVCPRQRTPRGGSHYVFRENGTPMKNSQGKLAENVDTRATGGYIVAAPSIVGGKRYEWIAPLTPRDDLPIVPDWAATPKNPPEGNLAEVKIKADEQPEIDVEEYARNYLAKIDGVAAGERRETKTFHVACVLIVGFGLTVDQAMPLFREWNKKCKPNNFPQEEIDKRLRHKLEDAVKEPGNRGWILAGKPDSGNTKTDPKGTATPVKHVKTDLLVPVLSFSPELLPDSIRPWVVDIAERSQCPVDFPAVGAMVCLATAVGRQVGLRPKAKDDWTVIPNLWGTIISRPGVMKSPPIKEVMKPLTRLEIEEAKKYQVEEIEYKKTMHRWKAQCKAVDEKLLKAAKTGDSLATIVHPEEPLPPTRRRYIVNDTTVAKMGEILAASPNGVLQHRDELMGFLKTLDKPGNEGDRAFYIESWAGDGRYTFDRIGRGTLDIPACCVSILSTTQPGPLESYLFQAKQGGSGDDGLIQRFQLMVWPDVAKEWENVDSWPDKESKNVAYETILRLANLDFVEIDAHFDSVPTEKKREKQTLLTYEDIPYLRFSIDAQERFTEWRTELEREVRSGDLEPTLESHLSKYRSLIPSLALLIHLADGKSGSVGITSLDKAIGWGVYLRSHAEKIYGVISDETGESVKDKNLETFIQTKGGRVTVRDIRSKFDKDSDAAESKLNEWVSQSKGTWEVVSTGGRPATYFVLANASTRTISPKNTENTGVMVPKPTALPPQRLPNYEPAFAEFGG